MDGLWSTICVCVCVYVYGCFKAWVEFGLIV